MGYHPYTSNHFKSTFDAVSWLTFALKTWQLPSVEAIQIWLFLFYWADPPSPRLELPEWVILQNKMHLFWKDASMPGGKKALSSAVGRYVAWQDRLERRDDHNFTAESDDAQTYRTGSKATKD